MGRVTLRTLRVSLCVYAIVVALCGALQAATPAPIAFTANEGQWDSDVLYRAEANGATVWFTRDGMYSQFVRVEATSIIPTADDLQQQRPHATHGQPIQTLTLRTYFPGASLDRPVCASGETDSPKRHYFYGNDPTNWHAHVPSYESIRYRDVYDGIDLKYYNNGSHLEYDFIVDPGADYTQIRIAFEGVNDVRLDADRHLVLRTEWGETRQLAPVVYQLRDGRRERLASTYLVSNDLSVSFRLDEEYDRTLPLVIDPILEYARMVGGVELDYAWDAVMRTDGKVVVVGYTGSAEFTSAPGSDQNSGGYDVTVTVFDRAASDIESVTYLGGSESDWGYGIRTDPSGNIYVCGKTRSTDFPVVNAYQPYQDNNDAFVTKLSPTADSIIYSTCLGTVEGAESAEDIIVDDLGAATVCGYSGAGQFFPVVDPILPAHDGTGAFLARLSPSGGVLEFSTIIGGTESDYFKSMDIDASGAIYLACFTYSADFPLVNPYMENAGIGDIAICKVSADLSSLEYSTYIGGSRSDIPYDIAVDENGRAAITGVTLSSDYPLANPYLSDVNIGVATLPISVLNSEGNDLVFSSYLVHPAGSVGEDVYWDSSGDLMLAGDTDPQGFPIISTIQSPQGRSDAFVTRLRVETAELVFSTLLGGSENDFGARLVPNQTGGYFLIGQTESPNFPVDPDSPTLQGNFDMFIAEIFHEGDDCCIGARDQVDESPGIATLGDLTALIDHLFISLNQLLCWEEANFDASTPEGEGSVSLGDLTVLVDHLFISLEPLPQCP